MSIILGIDPGTTTTGYGLIQTSGRTRSIIDYGVIHTEPLLEDIEKLLQLFRDITELFTTHSPTVCGVEKLFFTTNQKTAIQVAQARWVILLALSQAWATIHEFTPLQVKQGICGNGRATKKQVQNAVTILYKLEQPPKPDDAADALAIAYLTHLATL